MGDDRYTFEGIGVRDGEAEIVPGSVQVPAAKIDKFKQYREATVLGDPLFQVWQERLLISMAQSAAETKRDGIAFLDCNLADYDVLLTS